MFDPSAWPLWASILALLVSAGLIGWAGTRIARIADTLADRTGLGEAITGAVLLGASTSLSGLVTTATAAWGGYPDLAVSNCLGGIAAQTMFLALADMTHKEANLEHAAASSTNLIQAVLLVSLLGFVLMAAFGPQWTWWSVHPATPLLVVAYLYGMRQVRKVHEGPMWRPDRTRETRFDEPAQEEPGAPSTLSLSVRFVLFAGILGGSGWMVAESGVAISEATGLSGTLVGTLFTSVSTSLPELVTAIAAVRIGALTLAVGDIVGGNVFDTLFLAVGDVAYRDGSIYASITDRRAFLVSLTVLLTSILLMGLLRREKHGIANIGFESMLVLVLWIGGMVLVAVGG